MGYMPDKVRVEASLPIHMMLAVLLTGANCAPPDDMSSAEGVQFADRLRTDAEFAKSYEVFKTTRQLLQEASDAMLEGVFPATKRVSLLRRIERTHREAVYPYLAVDDPDPRKMGIIAYYLLQHLIDTGFLIVAEESALYQALDHMLPALSPWHGSTPSEEKEYERLNHSAQKQLRHVLRRLQAEGYYKGIPVPT